MYPHFAHVFIDGGYIRERARTHPKALIDPLALATTLVRSTAIQTWAYKRMEGENALIGRATYYDGLSDDPSKQNPDLTEYWNAIELQNDVHLGFGALRALAKKPRQKGVDTLLAVDMVVGAFSGLFDIAILVAGDADFVPAVDEVKRRGVMVAIAAEPTTTANELRRAADRYIEIQPSWMTPMVANGRTWAL